MKRKACFPVQELVKVHDDGLLVAEDLVLVDPPHGGAHGGRLEVELLQALPVGDDLVALVDDVVEGPDVELGRLGGHGGGEVAVKVDEDDEQAECRGQQQHLRGQAPCRKVVPQLQ